MRFLLVIVFAHFLSQFDEQKMGLGGSFCNAQNITPAMQRKQARSALPDRA
jgi:hypothetical protein